MCYHLTDVLEFFEEPESIASAPKFDSNNNEANDVDQHLNDDPHHSIKVIACVRAIIDFSQSANERKLADETERERKREEQRT
jgi:hypothetical protein